MEILIADDDPAARLLLGALVQKLGHQPILAANGVEALRAFEASQPDLLLIDGQMPLLDGYDATRRIRALNAERWTPILFIAAATDSAAIACAIEAGADDYLPKPVDPAVLRAKLAAVERVRRLYQQGEAQKQLLQNYHDAAEQEGRIASHLLQKLVSAEQLADPLLDCLVVPITNYSGDLVAAARTPQGVLHVMLADAVGHGLAAAINVLPIVPCFYAMTAKGFDLDLIAIELNRTLRQYMPVDRFVATTLIALDPLAHRVKTWNGGNPAVLALDHAGNILRRFDSKNLALGILAEAAFDPVVDVFEYTVACQVFACSDGVVEDYGQSDDGIERQVWVEQMLQETPPSLRMKRLRSALAARTSDGNAEDDMTVVLLKCDPAAGLPVAAPRLLSHWKFDATFDARDLREFDVPNLLLDTIASVPGMRLHLRRLGTVVTELFANALDHGLLRLAPGAAPGARGVADFRAARAAALARLEHGSIAVRIESRQEGGRALLVIRFRDSGNGFSAAAQPGAGTAVTPAAAGRGLALVRSLCASVEHSGNGNEVRAVYVVNETANEPLQAVV
jgi:CheY-like chemotaxis protein/anti-sigma regulatory factor (Ser/Thr protein kinase)